MSNVTLMVVSVAVVADVVNTTRQFPGFVDAFILSQRIYVFPASTAWAFGTETNAENAERSNKAIKKLE